MITAKQIQDILSLYAKFEWKIHRVLLTKKLRQSLADSVERLFDSVEIVDSEIDAVWFSRPSGKENEAWELRRLSEMPYALFEIFEVEDDEEVREEARREIEARLKMN